MEYDAIYDLTMGIKGMGTGHYAYLDYPLIGLFQGHALPQVHLHCRRIEATEVPDQVDKWLYGVFEEKEARLRAFCEKGTMSESEMQLSLAFKRMPVHLLALWSILAVFLSIVVNKSLHYPLYGHPSLGSHGDGLPDSPAGVRGHATDDENRIVRR